MKFHYGYALPFILPSPYQAEAFAFFHNPPNAYFLKEVPTAAEKHGIPLVIREKPLATIERKEREARKKTPNIRDCCQPS